MALSYMKRCCLLLSSAAIFLLTNATKASNPYILDVSQGADLLLLYDAGLRPWKDYPQSRESVHISSAVLTVKGVGLSPVTLDIEAGTFNVLAESKLSSASFMLKEVSLDEGLRKSTEVCQASEISAEGLIVRVAEWKSRGTGSTSRGWRGHGDVNGFGVDVVLLPAFGIVRTTSRVHVVYTFHEPGKPMKFMKGPLVPPPGYEHLSMDPPLPKPAASPFPDPQYDVKLTAQDFRLYRTASTPTPTPPTTEPSAEIVRVSHRGIDWRIVAIVAIISTIAGGLIWARRRR